MLNGKGMINYFNIWIDKKRCSIKMSQYFPRACEPFGEDINVKVDLSNYATKIYLKKVAGFDTSNLAAKSDLTSLKVEINQTSL